MRSLACVTVLVVLVALPGCSRFRKTKECELLARSVSAWLAKQPTPNVATAEPKQLGIEARATAKRYRELDRELGVLEIGSPDLVRRVASYRELARKSAQALEEAAEALERGDPELARRRRVDFDAISRAEAPLVAEINAACRR